MSIQERHLQGTATTSDATPTDLLTLPAFPSDGSFTLSGTVVARAQQGGQVTTFFPVNSGTIVAGVVTQSAGRAQACSCPTSPADGGAEQGFAPPGCSTLSNGLGRTMPFNVTGVVASLPIVGLDETAITWTWDLTLVVVNP